MSGTPHHISTSADSMFTLLVPKRDSVITIFKESSQYEQQVLQEPSCKAS